LIRRLRRWLAAFDTHWHAETFVCSRRGHVLPAATVARLRAEDAGIGIDLPGARRFARCLRCDSWREVPVPDSPVSETLPALSEIAVPRRGEPLREAIVIRIIALDRVLHVVLFGLLFIVALAFRLNIGPIRDEASSLLGALQSTAANSTQASQGVLAQELERIVNIRNGSLDIVIATAAAYFVLELVEAVGLWRERRWAEYLTVVATSGLLPFEILELTKRVTVIRVGALIINLAIVTWLLYRKRLFGIAGGREALRHESIDPEVLFGPPAPREHAARG
jgi:uncharacterized membrane protein (DUF2068 family)